MPVRHLPTRRQLTAATVALATPLALAVTTAPLAVSAAPTRTNVTWEGTPSARDFVTVPGARSAAGAAAAETHQLKFVKVYWGDTVPTSNPDATLLESADAVADYYADVTDGQVQITTDPAVVGWTKIAQPTCDSVFEDAWRAAVDVAGSGPKGVVRHVVAYTPGGGCGWSGQGWLGAAGVTLYGDPSVRVLGHELGHNFGLKHANLLTCRDAAGNVVPLSSECTVGEYGDPYDPMGLGSLFPAGTLGYFSAAHLYQLTGQVTPQVTTAGTTQTVTIEPIAGGSGVRALRFYVDGVEYTAEYRTAFGYDQWIDDRVRRDADNMEVPTPGKGVVVRMRTVGGPAVVAANPDYARLGITAPGLRPGGAVVTADGKARVEFVAVDDTGAATVRLTRLVPDATPPTAAYVAAYAIGAAGTTLIGSYEGVEDDDTGVASVALRVDGVVVAQHVPAEPHGYIADRFRLPGALEVGRHEVDFVLTDYAGNETVTDPEVVWGGEEPVEPEVPPTVDGVTVAGLARGGSVTKAKVPVTVSWTSTAGGDCGIRRHVVSRSGKTWRAGGKARSAPVTAAAGRNTFKVVATDWCGNPSAAARSPEARVSVDAVSRSGRHGPWRTFRYSRNLGGTDQVAKKRGAAYTATVTGRAVGWVATRSPYHSKVKVFVDGEQVAIVDLKAAATTYRQQVWAYTFLEAGRHKVKLVNLATRGRPWASVDGFTSLR